MPGLGQLGGLELVIILLVVMMVFGIGKLGDIGGSLGRGVREFKDGIAGRTPEEAERERLKG